MSERSKNTTGHCRRGCDAVDLVDLGAVAGHIGATATRGVEGRRPEHEDARRSDRERLRERPVLGNFARREGGLLPAAKPEGHEVMTDFERFLEDNPDMAEKQYGDAMAATLSRAFPCGSL